MMSVLRLCSILAAPSIQVIDGCKRRLRYKKSGTDDGDNADTNDGYAYRWMCVMARMS